MQNKSFVLFFVLIFSVSLSYAQKPAETEDEYEKAYKRRIQKETLYGVYIPKDLTEAFVELNRKIDKENQTILRTMTEEEVEQKLYFSLGRWIVHNWGFYAGSRLSDYMKKSFNVHHPEKMASFIIIAYHRNLKRESLNIKQLVELFEKRREEEKAAQKAKQEVIFEDRRIRKN